jgi:peptide/nickel transport system substrate-binding protein
VPQADLANFDPVWSSAYVVRNASIMVWDTLYGMDDQLRVQRQMVEAEGVSADGLTWTFRLRPGLKFHDNEPVLARDVVASIQRWSARDPAGQDIRAIQEEIATADDRTFKWVFKRPFPKLPLALGKFSTPWCFIMPARIAATDPFRQINEYVGSGPMRFMRNEWVPGAKAVFEKFAGYVPRQEGASWLAGGKRMLVDRIEWVVIPDPATASAALQNGEVDWWEEPIFDVVPLLRKNRNLMVDIADPLGHVGVLSINHVHPPFNDVRARRAILTALSQEDFMRAYVGDDDRMWKPLPGFFTPGTPLYNEEGGDILKGPRSIEAAKKLLAQSGYAGQPITCLAVQDVLVGKTWSDVLADLLKRLGMKVDFVATDWGTTIARWSLQKSPPVGGWHMVCSWSAGAVCTNPWTNNRLRAKGDNFVNGWANSPQVEAEIASWLDAKTLDEEKTAARRINKAALDHVVGIPLGFYSQYQAWRKNISGIAPGPLPFFWGVSKTV